MQNRTPSGGFLACFRNVHNFPCQWVIFIGELEGRMGSRWEGDGAWNADRDQVYRSDLDAGKSEPYSAARTAQGRLSETGWSVRPRGGSEEVLDQARWVEMRHGSELGIVWRESWGDSGFRRTKEYAWRDFEGRVLLFIYLRALFSQNTLMESFEDMDLRLWPDLSVKEKNISDSFLRRKHRPWFFCPDFLNTLIPKIKCGKILYNNFFP